MKVLAILMIFIGLGIVASKLGVLVMFALILYVNGNYILRWCHEQED